MPSSAGKKNSMRMLDLVISSMVAQFLQRNPRIIKDRLSQPLLFFFNDTATTEIYTLSLHDALPICRAGGGPFHPANGHRRHSRRRPHARSEEHTSELQSPKDLVCRLLLEKKKK